MDAPLGRSLVIQKVPGPGKVVAETVKVGAVIADRPSNTNIISDMFLSSLGPISPQTGDDASPYTPGTYWLDYRTFVQLADRRQAAGGCRRWCASGCSRRRC
jgi:hypothetical protein